MIKTGVIANSLAEALKLKVEGSQRAAVPQILNPIVVSKIEVRVQVGSAKLVDLESVNDNRIQTRWCRLVTRPPV